MPTTAESRAVACPDCGHLPLIKRQIGSRSLYFCQACRHEFTEMQPHATPNMPLAHTQMLLDSHQPQPDAPAPTRIDPNLTQRLPRNDPLASTRQSVISALRAHYRMPGADPETETETTRTPLPEMANAVPKKYRLRSELACGGIGRILLVEDCDLNRRVAMKKLLSEHTSSPEQVSRLVEEAQTIGQLEHPNIVPIYDIGTDAVGDVFFTMKYVRGETLADVIARLREGEAVAHAQYPWSRRVQIMSQVCDALAFAHSRGVIHRDLKPANIMIGAYGEVQVMDWGTAKLLPQNGGDDTPSTPVQAVSTNTAELQLTAITPHETNPGNVVGTVFYMSPEQACADGQVGTSSDIYALGAIMYEFFGLQRAHNGDTVFEVMQDVIQHTPKPLRQVRHPAQQRVPIELHYIVTDAMQKLPAQRYRSAVDLKTDLQSYLSGTYPIRCRYTAMKRLLHGMSDLIDNQTRCITVGVALTVAATIGALVARALT